MIYPKDFENKIGFIPLKNILKEKCETPMGASFVDKIEFKNDYRWVSKELRRTNEMKELIVAGISMPIFQFYNVKEWLLKVKTPGTYLNSLQLYHTALSFNTMREINEFFNSTSSNDYKIEELKKFFHEIPTFENLESEIFKCIDKEGNVKDNASPELYEIRKSIESVSRSMHKIMRRVIDTSINSGLIEKDTSPVLREGRMVIPVSSSRKRDISGILHDTSSTGKTVFIEPSEVVEAGNRIRELQREEEQEIIKILLFLTDLLRPYSDEISKGCTLLSYYDFVRAKALFAIDTNGEMPVIEKEPEIDWYHAIHPGLFLNFKSQNREVVPLNLKLDSKERILIISGPNAGGKSVTLKTVGVVQYMLQCGLLPTIYSNSHVGVFKNIFIDIGDEQSMENDLSTYSSHLSNMKYFMQNANSHTLILADEIGTGTEPNIGSALAQSILKKLGNSGCYGIITTHYQNLKIFAEKEEGFINGAMLFDRQHLRPTFQLSVGEPGSSFALEIARNIGLPLEIVNEAKDLVGDNYVDAENFLLDIQRDKRYWRNKRIDIKEKESRLNRLLEEYEIKADELKEQRTKILKEARQEAKEILAGANTQIERSIHEIRKAQADKEKSKEIRKELEDYKKSLEKEPSTNLPDSLKPLRHKSRKKNKEKNREEPATIQQSLEVGDYVKMENGGITGTIISIEGKKAEVAFGNLRTKIDISKLVISTKPKEANKSNFSISSDKDDSRERQLKFKNEIDVRGFRADEAIQAITYFLDDAHQFNINRVRILHGTGHGILRTLIREQLKLNPYVKDYRDEDVRLGGAGITVADLGED